MGDASAVDDGYRVAGVKVVLIIATAMRLDSDFDPRSAVRMSKSGMTESGMT